MAAQEFQLTNQACADLEAIADYLHSRSATAAYRVIDQLFETFLSLAADPGMGVHRHDLPTRLLMFVPAKPAGKYIVFYSTIERGILVTDIIHSARDWVGMFDSGER